jgi:hypothetical protein
LLATFYYQHRETEEVKTDEGYSLDAADKKYIQNCSGNPSESSHVEYRRVGGRITLIEICNKEVARMGSVRKWLRVVSSGRIWY